MQLLTVIDIFTVSGGGYYRKWIHSYEQLNADLDKSSQANSFGKIACESFVLRKYSGNPTHRLTAFKDRWYGNEEAVDLCNYKIPQVNCEVVEEFVCANT